MPSASFEKSPRSYKVQKRALKELTSLVDWSNIAAIRRTAYG
jgi:hypothetical protein